MGEESVRIFIIKHGRNADWKVLFTTDTTMHFVRAFELYERRWGIEIIFYEKYIIMLSNHFYSYTNY